MLFILFLGFEVCMGVYIKMLLLERIKEKEVNLGYGLLYDNCRVYFYFLKKKIYM